MKKLKIEIQSGANEIIHTLQNNGYEAFLVGGCVRDSILGRPIHDYELLKLDYSMELSQLLLIEKLMSVPLTELMVIIQIIVDLIA